MKKVLLTVVAALVAGIWLTSAMDLPIGPALQGLVVTIGLGLSTVAFGIVLDSRCEFCDATALDIAGGTGLALIGSQIDLSVARNIGNARQLYLVIQVTTAVDSAADGASVAFVLASDATAAIAVDGTASEHIRTAAIPEAMLVAGFTLVIPVPPESSGVPYEQFLGLLQDTTGEALTAGAINAFLTVDPPSWKAYPNAI